MAAELRLGVSFDLAYFRQQLGKLSQIAASEFTAPIKIKLDRRVVDRELNELQRLFARREYRININDSAVEAASLRIDALQNKISTLRNSVKSGIVVKVKYQEEGSFAAGKTGAAGLYEYMRTQGLSGGNMPGAAQTGRRTQFEAAVAKASNKELQDMLRRANVSGRSGLRTGAAMRDRLRELDDKAMESVLGNLEMRMREPRKVERSFLDKVARAVFWMAGVDPEYLKQQAAQRRALPNVSFPATVPPGPPIGPSSTGRALPPGAIPGALPGTAFGRQRFLPPQIGQDLNKILRNAAFAFVDALNARIRQVNVREIGRPALPPSMIRGLLPSAVGRTPSMYGGPAQVDRGSFIQQRIAEAYARSAARGATVMGEGPGGGVLGAGGSGAAGPYRPFAQPSRGGAIVPYQAPSQFGPASQLPANYFQAGKLAAGIRGLGVDFNQTRLPLAGAVSELGGEFATAAKQVLLFGTAYKALAFFTSLPGQAFEAAKGLQTIGNQLEAVTGSVQNADRSFAFIDDLANRFNVPLQSARDGFVKLYASMAPAGFSGSEIEGLFEGISKATATFGLSADKVDRVNYAFAQMASKGQIMSEELKGQLGDVLPGSLALFARAAQMSIPEFSKAMEDGAFKGEAMAQVLRNVAKIMNADFGGAAANAANTLQGALNGMQNAVQRLYEAFEPLVDLIAASVFPVLQSAIEDATRAIAAFSASATGNAGPANMLEGNARAIYDTMRSVEQIFIAVGNVVGSVAPTFVLFGRVVLSVSEALSRLINNPVGKFLTDITIKIGIGMLAAAAFAKVMGFQLVASLVTAAQSARTLTGSIAAMATALRTSEVAARAFRLAMTGLVVGGILMGIEALVSVVGKLANRLSDARNRAIEARDAIKSMGASELASEQRKISLAQQALTAARKGGGRAMVTAEQFEILKGYGLVSDLEKGSRIGKQAGKPTLELKIKPELVPSRELGLNEIRAQQERAMKDLYYTPVAPELEKVDLAPGKEKKGKKQSMDDLIGGDIKRRLDEAKAALEYDMSIRMGEAAGNEDAERMLKYYEQYRKSSLDLQAVQETTAQVQKYMPQLIANGIDPTEKLADLRSKETEILYEIATITQKHTNDAKKAAKEREEELKKEAERRKRIVELIEDAAIAAGKIDPFEAARIRQRRGFEADIAQTREDGTPGQVAQLQSLQAQTPVAGSLAEAYQKIKDELNALTDQTTFLTTAATGAGDAFGRMFTDILTGAQTWQAGLGNAFRSVASMFADMVAQMLAKWAAMQIIGMLLPGAGSFAGGAKLGGSVNMPTGVGIGAGNGILQNAGGQGFGTFGPNFGIRQFAAGGLVTGPTLGLVGEGRFNEAVVPLPNGKSIPVDLGGGAGNNISTNIVVNMNNGQASSQSSGRGGQALGREIEGAVRNVILKETRPGGLIYSGR